MGLFKNLFSEQLSSVIQWENQDPNLLWYQFPSQKNEIKNASKLIVAPGQGCVLVYEGKISDQIDEEGIFNLETDNHPFITNLLKIRQNFESEHKMFIYFYRKAEILNQGWGTASPIKYVDAVYHIPVEMGANGNFSYHISDVNFFFTKITGSKSFFTAYDMQQIIINRLPQTISSYLAAQKFSFQEIDANLNSIAEGIKEKINIEFTQLGLQLSDFKITGTQFDEKTTERVGKLADITTDIMAAQKAGLDYVDMQKLQALRDAARNEGGLAGAGVQLGAGMELGKKFNEKKDEIMKSANEDTGQKLQKLKVLLDEQIITQEEFEVKKKELLSNL